MLLNCGVGEDSWRFLGLQRDPKGVHHKGDQSWVFIGRTDVEAETPILWTPDVKSWLIRKDPDAGKDWGQEEKGISSDGWMASSTRWTWVWVNSGSLWWTGRPGVPPFWGCKESDRTKRLNWTELNYKFINFIQLFKEPVFGLILIFSSVWAFSNFTCFSSFAFLFSSFHFAFFFLLLDVKSEITEEKFSSSLI